MKPQKKISITFRHPLPKERNVDTVPIPAQIAYPMFEDQSLDNVDFFLLQYLLKVTYGQHKLHLESTQQELQNQAKALWGHLSDSSSFVRKFTKPRISTALKKFERLGFLSLNENAQ